MIAVVTLIVTLLIGCIGYLFYSRSGAAASEKASKGNNKTGTFRPAGFLADDEPPGSATTNRGNKKPQRAEEESASDDSDDASTGGDDDNAEGDADTGAGGRKKKGNKHKSKEAASSINRLLKRKQEKQKEKEARAEALASQLEERRREKEEQAEREKQKLAAAEAQEEAEEEALKELRAVKKQQDDEEYAKWTSHIGLVSKGELGSKDDADRLIDQAFIQQYEAVEQGDANASRVVVLDVAARSHQTDVEKIVNRLEKLVQDDRISGVFDDRGKFLFVTTSQYVAIARFLKSRGRVSFPQLIREANKLVTEGLDTA